MGMRRTRLAEELGVAGVAAAYDAAAKRLLSCRAVIGYILAACVPEYAQAGPAGAAALVLGGAETAGAPVEDAGAGAEGGVAYDIRADVALPGGAGRVGLQIGMEAQRHVRSWRWLLRRAFYYCARMLSSQRGVLFSGADYHRAVKVVSVWIVGDGKGSGTGSLTSFSTSCDMLAGARSYASESYDVIQVVVAELGDPHASHGVLRLLAVLLDAHMPVSEKERVLEEEYDMAMSEELEKGLANMGTWGEELVKDLVEEYRNDGREEGRAVGLAEGLAEGRAKGRAEGAAIERERIATLLRSAGIDEAVIGSVTAPA